MITAVRTSQSAPGKSSHAIEFAKEIAGYLKSKYGLDAVIKAQIGGPVGRVSMITNYDSLAEYEKTWTKIHADPEFHKIAHKASGIMNPGHTHDTLWRSV